ncbi:hypothetical protein Esti_004772 [Eimeria stiedai]
MISFPSTRLQQVVPAAFTAGSKTGVFTSIVAASLTAGAARAFSHTPSRGPVATLKTTPHWLEQCSRMSVRDRKDEDTHLPPWSNARVASGDETEEISAVAKVPAAAQVSRHSEKADVDDSSDKASNTSNSKATIYSRHHDLVKHILRLKARRRYRSTCGEMVVLGVDTLRSICSLHPKAQSTIPAAGTADGAAAVEPWKPEASLLLTDSPTLACDSESLSLHAAQTRLTTSDIMNIVLERKQPAYTLVSRASRTPQKLDFAPSAMRGQAAGIFPQPQPVEDFVRARFVLALDRLRYIWNVGVLLRCASAMGVDALFFVDGTADPFNWKTLEISRGLHCPIPYQWGNPAELLKMCERHGLAPIVADLRGDPLETLSDRIGDHVGVCCILGSESRGPSEEILRHAIKLAVPMAAYVDSLNVGVAGGIVLSALRPLVNSPKDLNQQTAETLSKTCMHAASV